jgi:flagellar hook-associated protein 1 FlgK
VWLAERVVVQGDIAQEVGFVPGTGQPLTIEGRALPPSLGGRVGGLLAVRDEDLGEAIRRLDEFAARLVGDVNSLHASGVDENGRPAGAFFAITGVGQDGVEGAAQRIEVVGALVADPTRVASGRGAAPAENGVALDIAALRNDPRGASGMLRSLIVDLGGRSRESQDLTIAQQFVVDAFHAQRESVSGVSLDEEAAHLLQFQRSYEAAARVLATADEMARTILAL